MCCIKYFMNKQKKSKKIWTKLTLTVGLAEIVLLNIFIIFDHDSNIYNKIKSSIFF